MERDFPRMYDTIQRLPLFLGIGVEDISDILGHTRFDFRSYQAGHQVIAEGEVCSGLVFLIGGQLHSSVSSDDHSYQVEEVLHSPTLLQPERLFGLTQRYTHTYTADVKCDLMMISKDEILILSDTYPIFRTNLLNIITTQAQRLWHRPWRRQPSEIRQKILRFFSDHCDKPAGAKTFIIKMQTLSTIIGESRLRVSQELHAMESEGLIHLTRERITIPAMEQLFSTNP